MGVQYSYPNLLINLQYLCAMILLCIMHSYTQLVYICVCSFVGSCLATKVFIVSAMGRGWVIIKYANDEQRSITKKIVI